MKTEAPNDYQRATHAVDGIVYSLKNIGKPRVQRKDNYTMLDNLNTMGALAA